MYRCLNDRNVSRLFYMGSEFMELYMESNDDKVSLFLRTQQTNEFLIQCELRQRIWIENDAND